MSFRNYPERGIYHLPKKNILVLSCIDLRLTDNLLEFLHFDNLANRYDHFALAGTSLLTQLKNPELAELFNTKNMGSVIDNPKDWNGVWQDHLKIAIALHDIRDVYIIEHEDCGAYQNFLTPEALSVGEHQCHVKFSKALAQEIHAVKVKDGNKTVGLNVHCFLLDLRGNIEHLYSLPSIAS